MYPNEGYIMNEVTKERLKNPAYWKRILYMVLFFILYTVAETVLTVVVLFQVIANLFSGKSNDRLLVFGKQLSRYLYSILLYFTYNTEERPFPFSDWPSANMEEEGERQLPQ